MTPWGPLRAQEPATNVTDKVFRRLAGIKEDSDPPLDLDKLVLPPHLKAWIVGGTKRAANPRRSLKRMRPPMCLVPSTSKKTTLSSLETSSYSASMTFVVDASSKTARWMTSGQLCSFKVFPRASSAFCEYNSYGSGTRGTGLPRIRLNPSESNVERDSVP